ncbi:hypothetical protein [Tenacibaculum xiamenense]|uniref:hypothetical protein n=1 Tax=Tenacibaculum xiamenense TaxID=1261553 RepID=UPI0038967C4E
MIKVLIENLLGKVSKKNIKETFLKFQINVTYKNFSKVLKSLTKDNYEALDEILKPLGYKWNLSISEYSYSASQDEYETLIIDEEIDEVKDIGVSFDIYKTRKNIYIIDETAFNNYLLKLNLETLISLIESFNDQFSLTSSNFEIKIDKNSFESGSISKQCNFKNSESLLFHPRIFYFNNNKIKSTESKLDDTFSKLSLIYSLVYICDSSQIKKDQLLITISGDKTFTYSLDFKKDISLDFVENYYQIFQWIYSESNKIEDKLGLSRNIISSYLKDDGIDISTSVFNSILSAYQIYVKGNISKYFEARNKIIEQVENTVKKINDSLEVFFSNFQKSTLVFISFFLSVFLSKVFKQDDFSKIFNKETSLVGLAFVSLSVLYLVFSRWILKLDKKRVKVRYENVKSSYKDVLIKEDIDNILNENSEYNDEMTYFNERISIYTYLWIASIIIFIVVLFITSDYLEISLKNS